MTGLLVFFAGFGGAALVALLAWTFVSSVRDLREEDAARAVLVDMQNEGAGL